mgnify:CR=1 FL=1
MAISYLQERKGVFMIFGYARVSTPGQARDGNGLEVQERELKLAGASVIYKDSFTGRSMERPEFDKLNTLLSERAMQREEGKQDETDTLVVTKLDRIARTAIEGSKYLDELLSKGISVNVLNMGLLNNTASGKLIQHVMFAFAEFERDLIIQRTQEGKAIARTKPGYRDGRPRKFTKEQLDHAMDLLDSGYSYSQTERRTKISISTLTRERRKRHSTSI